MRQRHSLLDYVGSIHFITTVTRAPGNWFSSVAACRAVLKVLESYRAKFELDCYGYVLMPDHLHALIHQAKDGALVSALMEGFKSVTSRTCRPLGYPMPTLWRTHYDDVPVPGTNAMRTKIEYMHANPVRRCLVERAEDFQWSSAREIILLEKGTVSLTLL